MALRRKLRIIAAELFVAIGIVAVVMLTKSSGEKGEITEIPLKRRLS